MSRFSVRLSSACLPCARPGRSLLERGLVAILFALLSATPWLARAAVIEIADEARSRLGLVVEAAQRAERVERLDQPGVVRVPNDRLRVLVAPVTGVLSVLRVAEGSAVRAGDALGELTGAGVSELRSSFSDASARVSLASAAFERARSLAEVGAGSERMREEARVALRAARGQLAAARARLVASGIDPSSVEGVSGASTSALVLRSPQDGVVLAQYADPGERLEIGARILEIGALEVLWVEVHVPIELARDIVVGAEVRVTAIGLAPLVGRVVARGRRIHEADGGVLVRAEVVDPAGELTPGQAVRVDLARELPPDAVRVPRTALVNAAGRFAVFVQVPGGFEDRSVDVLMEGSDVVVVRGDLAPGDGVVIRGTVAVKALMSPEGDAP